LASSDPEGLLAILDKGVFENLDKQDIEQLRSRAETSLARMKAVDKEQLELQREEDRDAISKAIQNADPDVTDKIDASSLDEAEQWTWNERAKADLKRRAEGVEIVTDHEVRSKLYKGISNVLRGSRTHADVLAEGKNARFGYLDEKGNFVEPMLNEKEFGPWEKALNTQYKEVYKSGMAKVDETAEGLLLQADSLGLVKNAPVRWKIYADFQQAWDEWIADKGDDLKISEIYPEGVRLATSFMISDEEAARQELEMIAAMKEREKPTVPPKGKKVKMPAPIGGEVELPTDKLPPAPKVKNQHYIRVVNSWNQIPESMQNKILALVGAGVSYEEIVGASDLKPYLKAK
jgi:hypothetical protein